MVTCPICQKKFEPKDNRRTKPFCSDRCRNVDLSRWLSEDYGLPWEPDPDADEWEAMEGEMEDEDDRQRNETANN